MSFTDDALRRCGLPSAAPAPVRFPVGLMDGGRDENARVRDEKIRHGVAAPERVNDRPARILAHAGGPHEVKTGLRAQRRAKDLDCSRFDQHLLGPLHAEIQDAPGILTEPYRPFWGPAVRRDP